MMGDGDEIRELFDCINDSPFEEVYCEWISAWQHRVHQRSVTLRLGKTSFDRQLNNTVRPDTGATTFTL
jgi:hypothetical protein